MTSDRAPGFPSTIGRVLERSARRTPDRLALTFADRRWTYADLDSATGRVAAHHDAPAGKTLVQHLDGVVDIEPRHLQRRAVAASEAWR